MFTKIKRFTQKVYDNALVAFFTIVSVLMSLSVVFVGLGIATMSGADGSVLGYVGLGFALLTLVYVGITLISPARRRVLFANTREEIKKVRYADAEIHKAKTIKQAKKEIKSEQKAERLS
tara:strand:- start:119 stop:478 length:360 start_codon:yes stop_codon:yes gene_type:complete